MCCAAVAQMDLERSSATVLAYAECDRAIRTWKVDWRDLTAMPITGY